MSEDSEQLFSLDSSTILASSSNSDSDTDSLVNNKEKVQPREVKKRKSQGTHFDKSRSFDNARSTSEYVTRERKEWRQVAEYFNVVEDANEVDYDTKAMKELLHLCNWFEPKEKNPEEFDNDSDDDEIPFAMFAKQHQSTKGNFSAAKRLTSLSRDSPGVSSLRLNSKMRLDSKPSLNVSRSLKKVSPTLDLSSPITVDSKKNELDLAFQGIMRSTSPTNTVTEVKVEPMVTKSGEDDFWGDVEF